MNNHDQNGSSIPTAIGSMRDFALRAYQKWRERGTANDFGKQDWIAADADMRKELAQSTLQTTHAARSIVIDEFSHRKLKTWTACQLDEWSKLLEQLIETLSEFIHKAELDLQLHRPDQLRPIAHRFCAEQSRLRVELAKVRAARIEYVKVFDALAREIPEFTKEEVFAHLDDQPTFEQLIEEFSMEAEKQYG